MAEYALVDSGEVKDVIVADSDFISAHGGEVKTQRGYASGSWVLTPAKVGIGYKYANSKFVTNPSNVSVAATETINLSVSAVSSQSPLTYQWRKDTSNIEGATSASYSKENCVSGDAGSYDCVVSCEGTSVTSGAATVTVS